MSEVMYLSGACIKCLIFDQASFDDGKNSISRNYSPYLSLAYLLARRVWSMQKLTLSLSCLLACSASPLCAQKLSSKNRASRVSPSFISLSWLLACSASPEYAKTNSLSLSLLLTCLLGESSLWHPAKRELAESLLPLSSLARRPAWPLLHNIVQDYTILQALTSFWHATYVIAQL